MVYNFMMNKPKNTFADLCLYCQPSYFNVTQINLKLKAWKGDGKAW